MALAENYLPIARPRIEQDEIDVVSEVLKSGWLTQGPWVKRFETAFATRHTAAHALATTSCTTALHLALASLGIGPGDEVIVPAFTWISTANVVVHCGATPVFVDVLADTCNIDPQAVAAKLSPRTRAIMPVHLFGLCADMDALRAVLPPDIAVIEDAACAAGASWRGTPAGALGDMGCFSFHPRKSVTCGEGGMLTVRDAKLAARAVVLRNHGAAIPEEVRHVAPRPFDMPEFEEAGFNYRMTDVQAAIGCIQLAKLDVFIDERTVLAEAYDARLAQLQWLTIPVRPAESRHALQAYVTQVSEDAPAGRDGILEALHAAGIGGRAGTHSITGLKVYRERFGTRPEDFPQATRLQKQTLALPLHNHMTLDDVDRVVLALKALGH